jgi:hypothetical protein
VTVTLDALGNIGDFVGGIAVVVTLVYLAFQIRQNTAQVRQTLHVARAQALRDTMTTGWVLEVARDSGLSALYSNGLSQPEQLTETERVRFLFLMGTIFGEIEKNHLMYEQGFLADERWEAQLGTLRLHLKQAGGKYYWERFAYMHTRPFVQVVDQERGGGSSSAPAV